jgi:hypothetical protein
MGGGTDMTSYNRHSKLKADVDLAEPVVEWARKDCDGDVEVYTLQEGTVLDNVRFSMTERVLEYAPDYYIKLKNGRMFRVFAAAKLEEIDQKQFDARNLDPWDDDEEDDE